MSARAGCAVRRVDVRGSTRPPVVLVHGAANSGGVWTFWQDELARKGWPAAAGAEIVGAWLDRALGRTSA